MFLKSEQRQFHDVGHSHREIGCPFKGINPFDSNHEPRPTALAQITASKGARRLCLAENPTRWRRS